MCGGGRRRARYEPAGAGEADRRGSRVGWCERARLGARRPLIARIVDLSALLRRGAAGGRAGRPRGPASVGPAAPAHMRGGGAGSRPAPGCRRPRRACRSSPRGPESVGGRGAPRGARAAGQRARRGALSHLPCRPCGPPLAAGAGLARRQGDAGEPISPRSTATRARYPRPPRRRPYSVRSFHSIAPPPAQGPLPRFPHSAPSAAPTSPRRAPAVPDGTLGSGRISGERFRAEAGLAGAKMQAAGAPALRETHLAPPVRPPHIPAPALRSPTPWPRPQREASTRACCLNPQRRSPRPSPPIPACAPRQPPGCARAPAAPRPHRGYRRGTPPGPPPPAAGAARRRRAGLGAAGVAPARAPQRAPRGAARATAHAPRAARRLDAPARGAAGPMRAGGRPVGLLAGPQPVRAGGAGRGPGGARPWGAEAAGGRGRGRGWGWGAPRAAPRAPRTAFGPGEPLCRAVSPLPSLWAAPGRGRGPRASPGRRGRANFPAFHRHARPLPPPAPPKAVQCSVLSLHCTAPGAGPPSPLPPLRALRGAHKPAAGACGAGWNSRLRSNQWRALPR
jgi:hypothetical protein